ncbi:MAG TPA: response regulator transcription factor [Caldilineaceae bacterium]|nr:response regulator transcription factor [Caldilineaceae bacterium]
MNQKIRVLLVEDEGIVAEAIAALLEMEPGISVVGKAVSAEMCLRKAHALRPDVILLDLRLPDRPGVDVISALVADNPTVRIVIVTGYADEEEVATALRAGAVGYVLKTQAHTDLVQAIEHAYQGRSSIPPRIAKIMLQALNPPKPPSAVRHLSEAERRILVYVAQGLENKEIARQLGLSRPTVHAHVSHILNKLELENRTQAALYAVKHGLVSLAQQTQTSSRAFS